MIYSFTKRWEQDDKRKGWQKSSRRRRWYRTHSVDGTLMLLVVPLGGPLLTVNRGRRWIMKRGMELGIYCSLPIFQFGASSISADTKKNTAPPESIRPVALLLWPIENLTTIDNESSRTSDVVYAQCPKPLQQSVTTVDHTPLFWTTCQALYKQGPHGRKEYLAGSKQRSQKIASPPCRYTPFSLII